MNFSAETHKVNILAIAAHPDDVELSCSGTLLKHIDQGDKVALVDLTQGELGSRGNAETRKIEAAAAAEILNISYRENLKFKDGFFEINEANLLEVIKVIRKYKPEIVLANAISDRHPDHSLAAQLVAKATFLSGLKKIETSYNGEVQEPHRPSQLFHYIQDRHISPDFVIDISDYFKTKMESVLAYKTQFYNPNDSNLSKSEDQDEVKTPISGADFYKFLEARARDFGRNISVEYAEGFTCTKIPGVNLLSDLV